MGQYPFPEPKDDCVALFTRGPCQQGEVVALDSKGALVCSLDECSQQKKLLAQRRQQGFANSDELQRLKADDGRCYPLGSSGPCPSPLLFSYDVFKMKTVCSSSQLFEQDLNDLDESYNQLYPEYDFYRVTFVYGKERQKQITNRRTHPHQSEAFNPIILYKTIEKLDKFTPPPISYHSNKRQDVITSGVFQVPGSLPPGELLNTCRPGEKNGNNFKCTKATM